MKVAPQVMKRGKNSASFAPPPIPFERPAVKELGKDDYVTLKLKTVPRSASSAEYSLNVPYFRSGTPEEWLKFQKNLRRVFVGQNLTTGTHKFSMARRLLVGDSLSHFEKAANSFVTVDDNEVEDRNETSENFELALQAVTEYVFPKRALTMQKRYMRRIMRKPKKVKTRQYCARYAEINKYLEEFPPFKGKIQCIPEDEVLEHLEFAVPNTWQKQMVLHGFNTVEQTIDDFIEFCERMEFKEDIHDSIHQLGQTPPVKIDVRNTGPSVEAGRSSRKRRAQFFVFITVKILPITPMTARC